MVYKVMVDWIKVLKVCMSKRHSLVQVQVQVQVQV